MALSKRRKFIVPEPGDDWPALARRALPSMDEAEATEKLKSWNLHMLAGRLPKGVVLGSDLIFVEPPVNKMRHMFPGKKARK